MGLLCPPANWKIKILKCKTKSTQKFHICSNGTHTHTCSEQSLRILMWNASYVQKHSNYTWPEWVGEKTREMSEKILSPKSMLDEISWQIATTVQKIAQTAMEVLGLRLFSSSENENWMEANPEQQVITPMQVRQTGQVWYHRRW